MWDINAPEDPTGLIQEEEEEENQVEPPEVEIPSTADANAPDPLNE